MRTIGVKLRNGKDPVHHLDRQGAVYTAYRVVTATRSTFVKQKGASTHAQKHISCIKHFHPEKNALAKHALELKHRINWSKTQIVAFENDFRNRRFIESFFINSTPNVINFKSSDIFPQIYKATFGYK